MQLNFPTTTEQWIAIVHFSCNKSMHSNFARHLCEILSYLWYVTELVKRWSANVETCASNSMLSSNTTPRLLALLAVVVSIAFPILKSLNSGRVRYIEKISTISVLSWLVSLSSFLHTKMGIRWDRCHICQGWESTREDLRNPLV